MWVAVALLTVLAGAGLPPSPGLVSADSGAVRPAAAMAAHTSAWTRTAVRGPEIAREPDDCLICHDDDGLTMERDGREVSLYIDPERYGASVHAGQDCVDCHRGFDPDEEPHADPIRPVDCARCHGRSVTAFRASPHAGRLACATCHGDAHATAGAARSERLCTGCHEEAGRDLQASTHGAADEGPACFDCHSAHRAEIDAAAACLDCHTEREFVHESMTHARSEFVLAYAESIHGEVASCADCHTGHRVLPPDDEASSLHRRAIASTCAACHEDVARVFATSEHGRGVEAGDAASPACTDCHGEHDIHPITDSRSPVSRLHEVEVCQRCHLDDAAVRARMTHSSAFVGAYREGVHGRAVLAGNLEAAVCSDCHGAHRAMKASDPASAVHPLHIDETCGRCHREVESVFVESIHGAALARGNDDAPTCSTCHGEHDIIEHTRADSPVAARNVSARVCGPCHGDVKLSRKYGFPSDRTASFSDSFHGLAGRLGSDEVANCVSCHGVHDILPASDPQSTIHPANLEATCGSCHPGANVNFTRGTIHVIRTAEGDRLLYWISTIYLFVIIVTIGSMAAHNGLDWYRKVRTAYQRRAGLASTPEPEPAPAGAATKPRLYVRMTLEARIQHLLMLVSFFTLVVTGFMLKFPEAFWVVWIRNLVGETAFGWRGIVHRIAAVVMVADTVYHLYYAGFTARGRKFVRDIWFRRQDARDFVALLRYNLGLSTERPRFGRFSYIEKAEYWALVWGTAVMTVTGFMLWFENQFMGWFSKLVVDVAETVHYWEAWLAFLAILVWHLYFVIFNPDVYPMNFSWITGKLSRREMEHDHPLELEREEGSEV